MPVEFHFLRPWWLVLFVPLIIFLAWFARRRFERRRWQDIVDPQLMPHVLIGGGYESRKKIMMLLALAGALIITAIAGPAWQQLPQPVFRNQDALVIALDLSRSMDTADIKPSRLARARFKITDILERHEEGQTALIAYAAEPFVISPLTDDTQTIISQLPALTTDLMPSQGSRADRALEKAAELLQQSGNSKGRILLVTDGADSERTPEWASGLKASGIRVSVLGVGTDDGGPIPGQGGFVKGRDGSIVITKLDAATLESIAERGGGTFSRLSANTSDIDRLLTNFDDRRPGAIESTDLKADIWREEGPWLLLPLLPLAALAFRRGVLAIWVFAALPVFLMAPISPAQAFEWSDLWSRPDQRANELFEAGDPDRAAELFDNPAWKGAANYRAGRYEESLAALDGLDDIESTYNRGNALAKLGRYDEAIAAYEKVLERDPGHHDAGYNRDLLIEQQQQQQQEQPESGQSDESGQAADQTNENPARESSTGDDRQDTGQSAENAGDGRRRSDPPMTGNELPPEDPPMPEPPDQPEPANRQEAETAARRTETAAEEPPDEQTAMTIPDDQPPDEDAQATEQWLRKIPDDPGGLLRRKFYYQYQQQDRRDTEQEQW